jgi:hypothetical protein
MSTSAVNVPVSKAIKASGGLVGTLHVRTEQSASTIIYMVISSEVYEVLLVNVKVCGELEMSMTSLDKQVRSKVDSVESGPRVQNVGPLVITTVAYSANFDHETPDGSSSSSTLSDNAI